MKSVLFAAALAVLAGSAAVAQPGPPPNDYPPCTHPGQDRCREVGGMGGHEHARHHHGRHHHHGRRHHHHHH